MTSSRTDTLADGLPESVRPLLTDLIEGLSRIIPNAVGVWVYGSVALGAFDERSSDIDLIVGTDVRDTDEELDGLATLHENLARRHTLGSRLEVQYLTVADLCGTMPVAGYPVFHEGSFDRAGRGDLNATTRWVLRKHGLTLAGQPMAELPLDVTWEDVRAAMRHNLTEYWPAYAGPTALTPLHDHTVVVWTVATLCRILSTVVDGVIIAKPAAVEIWSRRVPDRWRTLVQEVRLKQSHADTPSGYASPLDRGREVQGFVIWACAAGLFVLDSRPVRRQPI